MPLKMGKAERAPLLIILAMLQLSHFSGALQDFNVFREGSCAGIQANSVPVSERFVESCKYFSAGNKYHMYKMAAAMPNYAEMREDEYYYGFCPSHNVTLVEGSIGAAFGFGSLLGTFRITRPPNWLLEATPTHPDLAFDTLQQKVTLTDHKSFVFLVNCWSGVQERGWNVGTLSNGGLTREAQRMIEDHAAALGFKREHFVFLRYESCRKIENPFGSHPRRNKWGRRG